MNELLSEQLCPECGLNTMTMTEQNMVCSNCQAKIPLDIYMMSLQIIEKDIIIQALRSFLEPGVGRIVNYEDRHYAVGFDQNYNIITQWYQMTQGDEELMYVNLRSEEGAV